MMAKMMAERLTVGEAVCRREKHAASYLRWVAWEIEPVDEQLARHLREIAVSLEEDCKIAQGEGI